MLSAFRSWRRRRLLRRHAIADSAWRAALAHCTLAAGRGPAQHRRLRELATLFLATKRFHGAAGLEVDAEAALAIAIQAAVPILGLGIEWYRGWTSVIVYPGTFVARREEPDADGVVHRTRHALSGEAWDRGPLVLSWEDARPHADPYGPAGNVVIHECAHKLDMLDGAANGHPPLHPGMDARAWSTILARAYDTLQGRLAAGLATFLDPYAAESPAEFFAVASEAFFAAPVALLESEPELYGQLRLFYRQDPAGVPAGRTRAEEDAR